MNDLCSFKTNFRFFGLTNLLEVLHHLHVFRFLRFNHVCVVFWRQCSATTRVFKLFETCHALQPQLLHAGLNWSTLRYSLVKLSFWARNHEFKVGGTVVVIHILRISDVFFSHTFWNFNWPWLCCGWLLWCRFLANRLLRSGFLRSRLGYRWLLWLLWSRFTCLGCIVRLFLQFLNLLWSFWPPCYIFFVGNERRQDVSYFFLHYLYNCCLFCLRRLINSHVDCKVSALHLNLLLKTRLLSKRC